MCLGIPGKVLSINEGRGVVEVGNVTREVFMQLVPEAKVSDYVLVHAGCALVIINEKEAENTLNLLKEFAENEVYR